MKDIDPTLAEAIGALAHSVGKATFPELVLGFLGGLVRHDFTTMTRYSRFSKPEYLVHSDNYPEEMASQYLADYYRFDPFYRYWRSEERPGIVWLRDLWSAHVARGRYVREFLARSRISDEVGVFLPPLGGASIALFLERSKGRFSARERQLLQSAYPIVAGLHEAHVSVLLGGNAEAPPMAFPLPAMRPMLVTEASGNRVFSNAAWQDFEVKAPAAVDEALSRTSKPGPDQIMLAGNRVLHRERLDKNFRLAPAGYLWTMEQLAEPPDDPGDRVEPDWFDRVLTPRERDIVRLVLDGYPTVSIAGKLGLSRGTVKNHRRRIYYKLDITTERELFLLYINSVTGR